MKALLIVDPQKCFLKGNEIIDKLNKVQKKYSFVAISKYLNFENSPFIKKLNWTDCMPGSVESEMAINTDRAFVYEKTTYTSLTDDLRSWINDNKITHIDVCGVSSDACVLATAFSLFDEGYSFSVLSDYCVASKDEYHEMGIDIIKRNIDKT